MQDLGNDLIRKLSGEQLPRSISNTIKKIDSYNLPPEIKRLYKKYWNERSGDQIRAYRILDQHYGNIVDHIFLRLSPERNVLVIFPDDPKVKSKKSYTHDKMICGISLLRIGFDEIHDFIEEALSHYKIEPSHHDDSIGLSQWGDLRPFRRRDLGLLFQSEIVVKQDKTMQQRINAIRFSHLEDGRAEVQKLILSQEKLDELNKRRRQ